MTQQLLSGRVMVRHGDRWQVAGEDSPDHLVECRSRRNLVPTPVCNDQVGWKKLGDEGVIEMVKPRRNELPKVDARGRLQIVAANIDQVIVVVAPRPAPTPFLIDRYLVAAHLIGARTLLALNKRDLPDPRGNMEKLREFCADLDVASVSSCAMRSDGVMALREELADRVNILVGQSGVGKSSLINQLLPEQNLATAAVSQRGGGRHTTTTTRRFNLPAGGAIIDSPGVWEFGLWPMEVKDLESGFPEIHQAASDCRFRDCLHQTEPGCAVQDAVAAGQIDERRRRAFLELVVATPRAT